MHQETRARLVLGILMILAGGGLLVVRVYPPLAKWLAFDFLWPAYIIAAGALLLILGLLSGAVAMAVPAAVVAGIGGIFYWQVVRDDWSSWAYLWTLIPGFVGVGVVLEGIFKGKTREGLRRGLNLIVTSLGLYILFAFLAGEGRAFQVYWPLLLIFLGLWLILRSSRSSGRSASD